MRRSYIDVISSRFDIKYTSCYFEKCSIDKINDLQTMYIIKFRPKFNFRLPKNNLYLPKSSIHKRWLYKYGYKYKSIIDVNKIKSLTSVVVGSIKYYKTKDLRHIEDIFNKKYLNLSREIKKSIYIYYYINDMLIKKIAKELCLDNSDVKSVIDELKIKAKHDNLEKDKILKMYFCDEYKIKYICKSDSISEKHIIDIIIEYLALIGI